MPMRRRVFAHVFALAAVLLVLTGVAHAQTAAPSDGAQGGDHTPVAVVSSAPRRASSFGLGVRGAGQIGDGRAQAAGIGGELLVRIRGHFGLELAVEYQRSVGEQATRQDLPLTAGLRGYIGGPSWPVTPYLVAAGGVDLASVTVGPTLQRGLLLDGQVGGGLELRLGRHFVLTADARLSARKLVTDPASLPAAATAGLRGGLGAQVRLGAAVYF